MTTCSCVNGLEVYAGRDATFKFTIRTVTPPADPVVMNLTGASLWFSVKENTSDEDADALILKRNAAAGGSDSEIDITDAANGEMEIYIEPDDTVNLGEGDYWFDVVVKTSADRTLQVVAPSKFHVRYTITNTVT